LSIELLFALFIPALCRVVRDVFLIVTPPQN
jgi:hypothetical protein